MVAATGASRWWHYTKGYRLLDIVAAGKIQRAIAGVGRRERRAVWFTSRATWEPTATTGIIEHGVFRHTTLAEMVSEFGALVRLEVPADVARHSWADHRRIGQIDPRIADGLDAAAREQGSDPDTWRVSYHDVPIARVLSIEASEDGQAWVLVGRPSVEDGKAGFFVDPEFMRRIRARRGAPGLA